MPRLAQHGAQQWAQQLGRETARNGASGCESPDTTEAQKKWAQPVVR
jgi:hypothetical protein